MGYSWSVGEDSEIAVALPLQDFSDIPGLERIGESRFYENH